MTSNAPRSIDSPSLQFKQLCKLQTLNDTTKNLYKNPTHLLATSAFHGLIFVGEKCGVRVIVSSKIFEEIHNYNVKTVVQNYTHRIISLSSHPTHIDVNSDQKLLSVTFNNNEIPILRIYSIDSFFQENITVINEIRLSSTNGTFVSDVIWNPNIANVLTCVISDGSLSVYIFNDNGGFEFKSLPKESNSTCACWSPKGKQLVVGSYGGYLTQYLPELKAVKNFSPPCGIFNKPCTITNVKWLSNFQFIAVYKLQNLQVTEDDEIKSCIVVVNTPKNGPITYINYEDICFSSGSYRPNQFYFVHVTAWNLIFVASANGVEVGVLSLHQDGNTWFQWNMEESARVVLPMNKGEETFPVGIAIDYSSPIQTPIGESIVSMPVLHVLTDEGLLCIYLINNLLPSVPRVCVKPSINFSLQYFTSNPIMKEEFQVNFTKTLEVGITGTEKPKPFVPVELTYDNNASSAVQISDVTYNLPAPVRNTVFTNNVSATFNINNSNVNFDAVPPKGIFPDPVSAVLSLKPQKSTNLTPVITDTMPVGTTTTILNTLKPQINQIKLRNEMLKSFKKKTASFDSDIQEIKDLVGSIKIDDNLESHINTKQVAKLKTDCQKLQDLHSDIRNEIDYLKTSIIEVFACVQEVKSRQFQLMNPGYQILSGIQHLDPITAGIFRKIENNLNYVKGQAEKADKQLDEIWFKFNKKSPTSIIMKIPMLENIYETMVKQQKILQVLKLQTDKLEKQMKVIAKRFIEKEASVTNFKSNCVNKPLLDYTNEDSTLANLTIKALNLNHNEETLEPKYLAQKYSKEYAKRFFLSSLKQTKLQELHSTHSVTYIQSSRLQRLKRKSLIILSKSACVSGISKTPNVEIEISNSEFADHLISPVSSATGSLIGDECEANGIAATKSVIVSSTPVKENVPSRVITGKIISNEPPVGIRPEEIELPTCTISFTLPSSIRAPTDQTINSINVEKPAPIHEKLKTESVTQHVSPTVIASTAVPTIFESSGSSIFTKPTIGMNTINFGSMFTPSNSIFSGAKPTVTMTAASNETKDKLATVNETVAITPVSLKENISTPVSVKENILMPPSDKENTLMRFNSKTAVSNDTRSVSSVAFEPQNDTSKTVSFSLPSSISVFSGVGVDNKSKPSSITQPLISDKNIIKTHESSIEPISSDVTANATNAPSIFGGSGSSVFTKPNTAANNINFGNLLFTPSNSIFNGTKTTTSSAESKTNAFSTFSFANNKQTSTSSVSVPEITSETSNTELRPTTIEKSTSIASVSSSFSFASLNNSVSFTSVKSSEPIVSSITSTPIAITANAPTTSNSSSLFNILTSPMSAPSSSSASIFSSVSTVSPTVPSTSIEAVPVQTSTTSSNIFENTGSFFGGLSIGSTTTTAASTSIFGKPGTTNSIFGSNIFTQSTNVSSGNETKPLFGTGITQKSIFGQNNNQSTENKNVFNQSQGFQPNGSSMFGNSSLFGSGSFSPSGTNTGQANTFAPSNTGSIFGTGGGSTFNATSTNSPFQSTGNGFGSPPTFPTVVQQQQNGVGFGSPFSFQNAFKTNSSFSTFGSAPSFGGSPAFGNSPTKLFGQTNSDLGNFGATTQQQPTAFENLANDSTVSFGNLAQQQSSAGFGSPPTFGNPNTSSTFGSSNFGGSSFNSWR